MTPDTSQDYRKADSHTTVEFSKATHARLTAAQRDSESIAATIDRALDAYEREQALPERVQWEMDNRVGIERPDAEGTTNFRLWNSTHERLRDCEAGGTFDATIAAALDALERETALPDAVAAVCDSE